MAKAIATQEAVNAAADAMQLEGLEPSIVTVQERIGGGSYSTVKRYLDTWLKAKAEAAAAAPETPPVLEAKGQEMIRALWALAYQETQVETRQVKDKAAAEVAAITGELQEARVVINRLEDTESQQSALIEQQQSRLREIELLLAETQAQARRVTDLEKVVTGLRADLDAAREATAQKSVEAARLAGENEALRSQALELMAALKAPKNPK